jgi:uncharacterized protein YaaN involved in tellurite resistance
VRSEKERLGKGIEQDVQKCDKLKNERHGLLQRVKDAEQALKDNKNLQRALTKKIAAGEKALDALESVLIKRKR